MISYTVVLQPGAGEDVDNAYEWYEYQQSGLGSLFLSELESYYHKLELNHRYLEILQAGIGKLS